MVSLFFFKIFFFFLKNVDSFLKSLLNLLPYCFCFIFIFWPWGPWDLSSPTRNQAHTPCIKRQSINHWTTSRSQNLSFMLRKFFIYFQCFMVSLFFGPVAGGILVPQPGIKLMPPTVEAQSHNHWTTREVLRFTFEGLTLPTWGMAKMMDYVHNLQESASFSGFPFPGHAAPAEGEVSSPESQRLVWTERQCKTRGDLGIRGSL